MINIPKEMIIVFSMIFGLYLITIKRIYISYSFLM